MAETNTKAPDEEAQGPRMLEATIPMRAGSAPRNLKSRRSIEEAEAATFSKDVAPKVNQAEAASRFVGMSQVDQAARMGVWTPCTLPQYEGLQVLLRINNRVKLDHDRPVYSLPVKYRALGEKINRGREQLKKEYDEELDQELSDLGLERMRLLEDYDDNYHKSQTNWMRNYVLDFDPWKFSDIAQPDPNVQGSYYSLYTDLYDLYVWLLDEGPKEALRLSAKNS